MASEKGLLRIGTRGSPLALAQAEFVADSLRKQGFRAEICPIRTTGDRISTPSLSQMGAKGVFVKEIEEALLRREVRLAVHSLKDLPTDLPHGLCLASVPIRENPLDVLVLRHPSAPDLVGAEPARGERSRTVSAPETLDFLPPAAKLGTSSLRRAAQLLHLRPDLEILPLRGNLDTRLRKLHSIPLDAIVVAAAGLHRLPTNLHTHTLTHALPAEVCTPAPGQGALAIEARSDDAFAIQAVLSLQDASARLCVEAERAFLKALGGGCRVPIGALAQEAEGALTLIGVVCSIDGKRLVRRKLVGEASEGERVGIRLAGEILEAGGRDIIRTYEDGLPRL